MSDIEYNVPTGEEFKQWRNDSNITQKQISENCSASQPAISKFEKGDMNIGSDNLREMVEYINRINQGPIG